MLVNGINIEFNLNKSIGKAVIIGDLLQRSIPFVLEYKNCYEVYLPGKLKVYQSYYNDWLEFSSKEEMEVRIGMMIFTVKNIISEKQKILNFIEMAKIKLKQTLMGTFGLKGEGDVVESTDKAASSLVERGLAEFVDEPITEDASPATNEKKDVTDKKEKASVTISDNTGKEKKEVLKP